MKTSSCMSFKSAAVPQLQGIFPWKTVVLQRKRRASKTLQAKRLLLFYLSYRKQRKPKLHVLKTNQGEKMILHLGFLNYSTASQIEYQLPSEFPRQFHDIHFNPQSISWFVIPAFLSRMNTVYRRTGSRESLQYQEFCRWQQCFVFFCEHPGLQGGPEPGGRVCNPVCPASWYCNWSDYRQKPVWERTAVQGGKQQDLVWVVFAQPCMSMHKVPREEHKTHQTTQMLCVSVGMDSSC